jgi:hypothetical protein
MCLHCTMVNDAISPETHVWINPDHPIDWDAHRQKMAEWQASKLE